MHELFKEVLGRAYSEQPSTADHAIEAVIQALRRVLGTEELTGLRQMLVSRSLKNAG